MNIQKTTNYDLFLHNPHQRTFKQAKVQSIIEKMKRNGFPPSMAISVYKGTGGKLVINTGHHRLAAAKALGIPVLYVLEHKWSIKELSDEGDVNSAWSIKDHVANFAKEGNPDYQELLRLQACGLHLSLAASMLIGESAGSGNAGTRMKAGTFKVKTREHTALWEELHEEFGARVPSIYHRVFIQAWSKCLFTPEFDHQIFLKRLRAQPMMLDKCSTEDQMLRLIEELYNFKTPRKIPLAFLVTTNSKERKTLGISTKGAA